MNFGQIRDRIVERMAEYASRQAEGSSTASRTNDAIYARMTDVYRDLVEDVVQLSPSKIADIQSFTYAANSEYVDISTVPTTSMWQRPIVALEKVSGSDLWPLHRLSERQFRMARAENIVPIALGGQSAPYGWFVEAKNLFLLPRPAEALTLRATYVKAVTALSSGSDSGNSPDLLPAEHHPLIAVLVAISFLREGGTVLATRGDGGLLEEKGERYQRFLRWASGTRGGNRRVREV